MAVSVGYLDTQPDSYSRKISTAGINVHVVTLGLPLRVMNKIYQKFYFEFDWVWLSLTEFDCPFLLMFFQIF